jgi:hypothetical protein
MGETMSQLSGGNGATGNAGEMLNLTGRARSLANLKPFRPGHSVKSPGRPRKNHILERELERALKLKVPSDPQGRSFYRLICESIARQAAKGSVEHARLIFDRTLGRVRDVDEPVYPTSIVVNVVRNQERDFCHRGPDDPAR